MVFIILIVKFGKDNKKKIVYQCEVIEGSIVGLSVDERVCLLEGLMVMGGC